MLDVEAMGAEKEAGLFATHTIDRRLGGINATRADFEKIILSLKDANSYNYTNKFAAIDAGPTA